MTNQSVTIIMWIFEDFICNLSLQSNVRSTKLVAHTMQNRSIGAKSWHCVVQNMWCAHHVELVVHVRSFQSLGTNTIHMGRMFNFI
jgi:hypothetical protein